MTFAVVLAFIKKHERLVTIAASVLLGLLVAFYMTQCGTSKREEHIGQLNNQATETTAEQTRADVKVNDATAAAADSTRDADTATRLAKTKVAQARSISKVKNVSVDEANKSRVETYPGSEPDTPTSPVVQVTQGFVDDANQAFKENKALRDANTALEIANAKQEQALKDKDTVIAAQADAIKARDETIKLKDQTIEEYRKIKCDKTSFLYGLVKNTRCH